MYETTRRNHEDSASSRSSHSRRSNDSYESRSTAPTTVHNSPRPSSYRAESDRYPSSKYAYETSSPTPYSCFPRSSTETYASGASEQDLCEEPETYDPEYEVPEYHEIVEADLRPTNPNNFADYFPSTKRLSIRHDDTTYDGNMNLRIDAEDYLRKTGNVQLFHLRMQDLKKREFSLRRYERSSGRELCHSSRKYAKPASEQRPALTRSMSSALASIRKPEFKRTGSGLSTSGHKSRNGSIKRQDSGYASVDEDADEGLAVKSSNAAPTNSIKLEFSNYAQVEVTRRGKKSSKRYDFEYWGQSYSWRRVAEMYAEGKSVSYHLHHGEGPAIAHIVPELRSPSQMRADQASGGWVPPCSMWISDETIVEELSDVADVIIATGLMALVDDSIKRHFHPHKPKHGHRVAAAPLTPLDFVKPMAMVEHMFKRRNSGGSAKGREKEQRNWPKFERSITAY
ncbi:Uncharacterized protein BP5553_04322 [Venustampulla echinocandica]|uniref:Uncharacterized protein n=1 Tax=Venustampulla echinocandica TaxID=2656787 RepID=A0A370TWS9_9HELO|nr:Uncharacterized protein BP5553_04322 [Venustampulla echinocandica]RDL39982.1 Uncharacterized protein BP5553_04322 [Venustampulla echinocandica]